MPLPLLIPIAMGLAGLYGAGKGVKAIIDNNEASDLNESANEKVKRAEDLLASSKEKCSDALNDLGKSKIEAIQKNVKRFLTIFEKIKNVDFVHDNNLDQFNLKEFDDSILKELSESVSFITTSGIGIGGGAVSGAVTAFGAYSGTMAMAAAGTGTAISSLSGAAATNATLAWLGGGTLASGGFGMAGGALALGAMAAGPALLLAGWYMGSKAEENLDDAKANREIAAKFVEDVNTAVELTNGIISLALASEKLLSRLRTASRRLLLKLNETIEMEGVDYKEYSEDAKVIVMKNVKLIQLIKVVINTSILDKDGNLLKDADVNLNNVLQCFSNDLKGNVDIVSTGEVFKA